MSLRIADDLPDVAMEVHHLPEESDQSQAVEECIKFYSLKELSSGRPAERLSSVIPELRERGHYDMTSKELETAARLAWRNHAKCVGRKHWRTLKLIDARDVKTASELAEACMEHIRFGTNGGAIKSTITVGPTEGFKIISPQLIRYAGYQITKRKIMGDPAHIELTKLAQSLGWSGKGTQFDVLPLIIRTGKGMEMFEVPEHLVLEVEFTHPEYSWFADLGLKWHALPAVSNMTLAAGGLKFPVSPFNGWYVSTEIGARNFSDKNRYDKLPVIAEKLGLDTSSERTLWRDRALVELNIAVIHSYRQSGVRLVDHHTVAQEFIKHVEKENTEGRSCPTDWSWINPPMSSGLTPTFHRYFDEPVENIRPDFIYDEPPVSGCPFS